MSADGILPSGKNVLPELDSHLEPFLDALRSAGYAQKTIKMKRCVVRLFIKWLCRGQGSVLQVDESHITKFLKRAQGRSKYRLSLERPAICGFIGHFRTTHGLTDRTIEGSSRSKEDLYEKAYTDYLRDDRGLSERSVDAYRPLVREFIDIHCCPR